MATITTASVTGGGKSGGVMAEVIADKNYFFDAEGNVTDDESKGERWLAREGANVMEEHREALDAFQSAPQGKVARQSDTAKEADAADVEEAKAAAPKANKKATPSKNKGVK